MFAQCFAVICKIVCGETYGGGGAILYRHTGVRWRHLGR